MPCSWTTGDAGEILEKVSLLVGDAPPPNFKGHGLGEWWSRVRRSRRLQWSRDLAEVARIFDAVHEAGTPNHLRRDDNPLRVSWPGVQGATAQLRVARSRVALGRSLSQAPRRGLSSQAYQALI